MILTTLRKLLFLSQIHTIVGSTRTQFSTTCPAMLTDEQVVAAVRQIVPKLHYGLHKGQCGRIGVIGGSEEYTGAPYFAAITALKVGADLAHVFCTRAAAPVIKSYSPELIVHPVLDDKDVRTKMQRWMANMHAMVIGPGLGRDEVVLKAVGDIIKDLKGLEKPLVIDADGVFLVTKNLTLVQGYKEAILTPNEVEFIRLKNALNLTKEMGEIEETVGVSEALGGVTVLRKSRQDIIAKGDKVLRVHTEGSPRRCGGQGDLLSGSAALFYHWALNHKIINKDSTTPDVVVDYGAGMVSAHAAGLLSKLCACRAFEKHGRSTTTSDLINEIHEVFQSTFEENDL